MEISVAVRVRPFLPFEAARNPGLCVQMSPRAVFLHSLESTKTYPVDYPFWSHTEDCVDPQVPYSSTLSLHQSLGRSMIAALFQGVSSCVFTYGGCATGKTYTMRGNAEEAGLIALVGADILQRAAGSRVTISVMEIELEKVHDLLAPKAAWSRSGLKVRDLPTGVVIEGLSQREVTTVDDISRALATSQRNWCEGNHQMNADSKAAHYFVYYRLFSTTAEVATVLLADLAGCERLAIGGYFPPHGGKAVAVNRSLSSLCSVLRDLRDQRNAAYRDSALTTVLRQALQGRMKTTMIATISPDVGSWKETIQTLEVAQCATQVRRRENAQ